MSFDFNDPNENPYASTFGSQPAAVLEAEPRRTPPGLCTAMIVVSLIFCVIRLLLGMGGLYVLDRAPSSHPLATTFPFEILTNVGIGIFGIAGNGLLLFRQHWAVALGYLVSIVVLSSILVGLWQTSLMFQVSADATERNLLLYGGGFITLLRLAIVGLYVYALFLYQDWAKLAGE